MQTSANPINRVQSVNSAEGPVRLPFSASSEEVVASIRKHGYALVEGLAPALTDQAARELEPYFARASMGSGSFTGERTQRLARLVARSAACRELVTHPLLLASVKALFEGQCYHPQLAMTQAIRIHPGQAAQELHRDDNVFPFRHPRPPSVLFCNWAISDFTATNGATRLIPGSHTWDDERSAAGEPTMAGTMSRGSVLLWEGATYHGGGGNTASEARTGVVIGYSLGWLRQYENQYLAVPPELARQLSPELASLIGYHNHGYLGTWEHGDAMEILRAPAVAPTGSVPLPAPVDLFTSELERLPRARH